MITIYEATETSFDTLGLGTLAPSSCKIVESLNGQYELDMDHPIDGKGKWEKIANNRVIKAPTHDGEQLFRIYNVVKNPITGNINVNARHIFYDLLDNLIEDARPTAKNGQDAGNEILAGCQYTTPFSFTSDIEAVSTAYYIRVNPVQAFIGSNLDQSFINRWGGEICRNNFEISINTRRGSDKGVRIAYGKNITGIDVTEDVSGVYTRIMPIAVDENNVVFYTDEKYYDSPLIGNYPHPKIGILNTGIRVGQTVNGEVLYPDISTAKAAMAEMANVAFESGADKPKITINVSFIQWQDTDQYKSFKVLYTLGLGDDVTVDYAPLNLTYKLRVISITWDAVNNRAESMTLGDKAPNLAQSVVDLDIDLSALRNDMNGALMEGEVYNGVYINHTDGFMTEANVGGKTIITKQNSYDGFALYEGSTFLGGTRVINGKAAFITNMLINAFSSKCYAEIGKLQLFGEDHEGIFIYHTDISEGSPALSITTNGDSNYQVITVSDKDGEPLIQMDSSGGIYLFSKGSANISTDMFGTALWFGDNCIGVDSIGPYYVKNGTQTYL